MRCTKRRGSGGLSSAALGLGCGLLLGLLLFHQRNNSNGNGGGSSSSGGSGGSGVFPTASGGGSGSRLVVVAGVTLATTTTTTTTSPNSNTDNNNNSDDDPTATPPTPSTGLLCVGVMTARKYLGTRAKAVHETWGAEIPGRIDFYSSEASRPPLAHPQLPLVALSRVDDSYPPQKKSFMMLQHMWTRYGERYEWFMRADDDVYVRTDRLERLLRSVDSRRASYVGQAGRGNSEEFGLLSLEYDENFCMGGPGVILSRETLRRIVPHIKYCLGNLYTGHEDVELGRCVRRFAGISCTWSYEMQSILYHNSSGDLAFTGKLKSKEVHRAISMHPIKSPPHMYRLHNYMRSLKIQDLQQKRVELERDAERMDLLSTSTSAPSSPHPRRLPHPQRPRELADVPIRDLVARSEYGLGDSNPRRRIHGDLREGLEDATREVMAAINACSRQRGRFVEERQALYGYRSRTARGADTVLDLLLMYRKYRGRKVTLPVRRHLYLHQQFTGIESREVPEVDLLTRQVINFVVPVAGRHQALLRFLRNYERVCLSAGEPCRLLLVLYPDDAANKANTTVNRNVDVLEELRRLERRYNTAGPDLRVVEGQGRFSRARALDQAAQLLEDDDLMFFVDVDIGFEAAALRRLRLNAVRGRRIYFPVVFSQYDPEVVAAEASSHKLITAGQSSAPISDDRRIHPSLGFWRIFGFGIVALYRRDYRAIGGLDLGILGWGKEDVDFYERTVHSAADLTIFRAPDVDLVHVYHAIECSKELSAHQAAMCRGTRADAYASVEQLAGMIYREPEYLRWARRMRMARMNASSSSGGSSSSSSSSPAA